VLPYNLPDRCRDTQAVSRLETLNESLDRDVGAGGILTEHP
jgi:hypothetical protein